MNNKEIIKLAILETKIDEVQKDITCIKDNHLSSIYKKLDDLTDFKSKTIAYATIGAFFGSIVIQALLRFVK